MKIGACISEETKQDLIELLQEFKDVFAWSYQDMLGLSTDIMVHRLLIKEECKPVQQKLRRMRPDVASPKDNFLLRHIDTLVDNMAGYSLFSFMDGFSGYNHIKMHPEDMEKTILVTLWGTFCYKVMPFGFKIRGATYLRAIVTLFHDMMHKEIEVYVDDMIVKSRTEKEHVQILRKLFLRLKKFQLKLNLTKCTFGARSGKLLGFVVSEKGVEIDPDKFKAIQELLPSHTKKEVRGFLGRLNYIAGFISQLTEKCDPIFRLLKKHNLCKAVKGSAIADFLTNRALEDYEPLNFDFPNEDLMYVATTEEDALEDRLWKLNFDRASNATCNGIEAVLVSSSGDHYPFTCKLDFDCTNNMAEYEACFMGICAVIERKIKVLEVYVDSSLVIYQLKGKCETRDPKLIDYKRLVLKLIEEFDNITFCYLPRDENQMADALATLAFMVKAEKILEEIYECVCGTHANGFTMARQIMRFRYYWSTMEGDCINYAKKCHKCQIYGDKIHVPPSPLHVITSPWPFSMWGMDVIGPISPKASNGHRFIFVVIDYFTRWVEAASYDNVTKSAVSKF
ncbi:reverse transcriptase [Gossypium australe]|uniref:Reverse transcriptase n=1 Tax=Gossypium australe TaxID=47621 RepID=A0A5B6UY82_9ROSI|nr:reverse transcriptase [Gossypium australe]